MGLYLLVSIIGFSFGLLLWTYHNAMVAIDQELQNSFEQRHTIAEIILEYQFEIVDRHLQDISKNEVFLSQVSRDNFSGAEQVLSEILYGNPEYQLDVAFVSLSDAPARIDANSPFFDLTPILGEIASRERDLLSSDHILRFKKQAVDLTIMLKAAPLIHNRTGKVLGTLFGGIVLNDNLSILEDIQQKTQTAALALFESGEIIGSTDLFDAQSTRTLQVARRNRISGEIYDANNLLSSYDNFMLDGRATSLEIAMAIPNQTLHALRHSYQQQGLVVLLLTLVFLLLTFFTVRWFIWPSLKKILDYSTSVSSGNLQASYIPGVITEFNQFGRAAEQMVETIREEIEERKQAQEALQALNTELDQRVTQRTAELEAANRAKSVFLANMSHELRTPLNAILGFSQLIARNQSIPREHKEHIDLINRSGEHLLTLINQVLDMSKIEAGHATVKESAFDLGGVIGEIEQSFRPRAETKGLDFHIDIGADVPRYIRTDELKLRQVLLNLLTNAIKYTVRGMVSLKVNTSGGDVFAQTHEGSRAGWLHISVEDSGPGIADDQVQKVFEAFVMAGDGMRQQEGVGLGLALSKQLAELMGGQLTVRSEVGKGSEFSFELPLRQASAAEVQPKEIHPKVIGLEAGQPRYRILVVDDVESSRRLVTDTLMGVSSGVSSEPGFEVRQAVNGQEAVRIWHDWHPHLIWMDIRMPVMDGFEATRQIKATEQGRATTIIGLSASAFEEQRFAVLEAGCDDFIRKPFRISDFFHIMYKHIGVRYVYEAVVHTEGPVADMVDKIDVLAKSLASVEETLLTDLRRAVEETNPAMTQTIIDRIAEKNKPLASELSRFADNFRFDLLQDILGINK